MNKFLIGCGAVLLIAAILIGVLILETPRFLEAGKEAVRGVIAEESRVAAFESSWQPPSPVPEAKWLPKNVGEWTLEKSEAVESVPAIGLSRPGISGLYRSNRGVIEVSIVPVSEEEKAGVLQNSIDALQARVDTATARILSGVEVSVSRSAARLTTTRGNRTYVRLGAGDHTRFWWLKGCLLVCRAQGTADSETFPEELLRASSLTPLPLQ